MFRLSGTIFPPFLDETRNGGSSFRCFDDKAISVGPPPTALSVADNAKVAVVDHLRNGGADRSVGNAEFPRQRAMRWISRMGVTVEISGERDGQP